MDQSTTTFHSDAVTLLDRALKDYERHVQFHRELGSSEPLLLPERRWDLVKQARDILCATCPH